MCDCCRRLLALLRLIEHGAVPCSVVGDDAVLDAWFGPRSRVFGGGPMPAQVGHSAQVGEPHTDGYP
jgi:hypothetical protein